MITILGYQEALARQGEFDFVISINDANIQPIFRVRGKEDTLYLNFNDVWFDDEGQKTI